MCGIVCYLGRREAAPILLEGLRRLEYRGYDSAGMAVFDNGSIASVRALGKIGALEEKLSRQHWRGRGGIAHTRWATHGKPSEENAHPHSDCHGQIFVIHNGILENHQSIKNDLLKKGHHFSSETDTEVLAHLIEEYFEGNLETSVSRALRMFRGTFGVAVMAAQDPDKVVVARRGSPLILGIGEDEVLAASDVTALVNHTHQVIYLQDNDVAILRPGGYRLTNLSDQPVRRHEETVEWDVESAERQGYEHFMLKEIHEQPEAVENALRGRLLPSEATAKLGGLESVQGLIERMDHLIIVSCGTSYYAGLVGRYILEALTDIPVEVELASEFRYRKLNLRKETAVLAISQSGETADTLAAVREARRKGNLVLGLVNVVGSSIARETDAGVYNHAGPEIGVASTKAFTSQLTILYLIALLLARRQRLSFSEGQAFAAELRSIPDRMREILAQVDKIEAVAKKYAHYRNFLYVGRKFNFPIALEGALKLKEISYLHAEGYAAGEMKHGPIALIDSRFPTVCLAPRDSVYEKVVSNVQEIKARGGPVLAIANPGDKELSAICDDVIEVPAVSELFTPLLTVLPLQLLAYYVARERGCEIDQPRNLAKSVTVE